MQITGVALSDFSRIVNTVSAERYEGNLVMHDEARDLHGKRAPRIRARVTVRSVGFREGLPPSETLPGVRRSSSVFTLNKDGTRRRVHAACWHAYRDVLTKLFDEYPDAVVRTAFANYHGKRGFEIHYPDTAYRNIGSLMYPVEASDACDCED